MLFRPPLTLEDLKYNRRVWSRVLRGDTYQQAKAYLATADGYCCLGVLCELAGIPRSGNLSISGAIKPRYAYFVEGSGPNNASSYDGTPPPEAMACVGLKTDTGSYRLPNESEEKPELHSLSCDNDHGQNFAQIADTIDAEPAGLFSDTV